MQRRLRFLTYALPLELRVNDILIPLEFDYSRFPSTDPIMRAGDAFGDISAFAGQTVELKFTTPRNCTPRHRQHLLFAGDNSRARSWALFALGGIGLFFKWGVRRGGVQRIEKALGAGLTSLNHSLVAEMIRRCNSRSAALPLALDLDPALDLDWVKARSGAGARARGGFGSALVFRGK